eukprot:gene3611-13045_t
MRVKDIDHSATLATTFYSLKQDFEIHGRVDERSEKHGTKRETKKVAQAMNWFEKFIDESGDRAPDEEKMFLPTCYTKEDIYFSYVAQMHSDEELQNGGGLGWYLHKLEEYEKLAVPIFRESQDVEKKLNAVQERIAKSQKFKTVSFNNIFQSLVTREGRAPEAHISNKEVKSFGGVPLT